MRKPCPCPLYCKYCGRRRSKDSVGHYCKTRNCQWQHGYRCCTLKPRCKHCESPYDIRQEKKCGGYCFGCWNCGVPELREGIEELKAENARLKELLAEALPFVTPSVDLLLRKFNDIDGADARTRQIIAEIQEKRDRIAMALKPCDSVAGQLVSGMTQLADDLEKGDLSGYRATTVRELDEACPLCERTLLTDGKSVWCSVCEYHEAAAPQGR